MTRPSHLWTYGTRVPPSHGIRGLPLLERLPLPLNAKPLETRLRRVANPTPVVLGFLVRCRVDRGAGGVSYQPTTRCPGNSTGENPISGAETRGGSCQPPGTSIAALFGTGESARHDITQVQESTLLKRSTTQNLPKPVFNVNFPSAGCSRVCSRTFNPGQARQCVTPLTGKLGVLWEGTPWK
jgi:hypothetical protein